MKSFIIFGQDNGKFAYNNSNVFKCSFCGAIYRSKSTRLSFKQLKYDVSCTYDNELLISKKIFDEIVQTENINNFEKSGEYYYVLPIKTVSFDFKRSETQFGKRCNHCGSFSHVIGITPTFLKKEISESGVYKTDLEFGDITDDGSALTPGIIITEDILLRVKKLKPTGFDFELIYC